MYVLVATKSTKDVFKNFSIIQNIKYSIFQKQEFIYSDEMTVLRRNAQLL